MEKIITKGLEILNQREDLTSYNFDDFDILPPTMQIFYYYYNVPYNGKSINLLSGKRYLFTDSFVKFQYGITKKKTSIVTEKWFNSIDCLEGEVLSELFSYTEIKNEVSDIKNKSFITIGTTNKGNKIAVGINENNKDCIYKYREDTGDLDFIYTDIFALFYDMVRIWYDYALIDKSAQKFSGEDVCRVWGESDWRIRKKSDNSILTTKLKYKIIEYLNRDKSMLLKKGIGLLKQREEFPAQMKSVLAKMPYKAKIFYKYYNTGTYEQMFNCVPYELQLPDNNRGLVIEDILDNRDVRDEAYKYITNFDGKFHRLYTFEELEEEFSKYIMKTSDIYSRRYIFIGEIEGGALKILLGVSGSVKDKVLIRGYSEIGFDDIFHFFTFVNRYWSDKDIVKATNGAKTGEDLYQNWGENFWRVK